MMSYFNARCCVAPAYNPKSPTGYDDPGKDCPVYASGSTNAEIIGHLSAGEYVEVNSLGGDCRQFWEIEYTWREWKDDVELTHKGGWVQKGHLRFIHENEKTKFEGVN